jgi:hypothetical protein
MKFIKATDSFLTGCEIIKGKYLNGIEHIILFYCFKITIGNL